MKCKGLDALLLVILAAVPLAFVPVFYDRWEYPKEALLLLGVAVASGWTLVSRAPVVRPWAFLAGLLLVFAGGVVAASPPRPLAVHLFGFGLALVFASRTSVTFLRDARRVMMLVVSGEAVLGVVQLGLARGAQGKLAMIGTAGNPEWLAGGFAMALLLLLDSRDEKRNWETLRRIAIGLAFAGLFLARSRGAWLAFAAAWMVVTVARAPRGSGALARRCATGAIAVAVVVGLALQVGGVHTLRGRALLAATTWHQIVETRGLGGGFGSLWDRHLDAQRAVFSTGRWDSYTSNAAMVHRAHDEYLDFLAEGGALALAGFLLLLLVPLRIAWRDRTDPVVAPFAAILVFAALDSLVSFPFHLPADVTLIALAMGALLARDRPRVLIPRPFALAAAAVVAALVASESRNVRAEILHRRAVTAMREERWSDAEPALTRAAALSAADPVVELSRARLFAATGRARDGVTVLDAMGSRGRTIDALKLRGVMEMELHDWQAALRTWGDVAGAFPEHVTPHYQMGRVKLELDDPEGASIELRAALARRAVSTKGRMEQERAAALLESLRLRAAPPF